MIKAEIVAHSLSPQGDELISVLCTFPRIILAEVNTHRMLSKNTSSSRAIPFKKMVESVQNNPFIPIAWQKEHTGMQGFEYFTDKVDLQSLEQNWLVARDRAVQTSVWLNEGGLTKQLCNRLLEPFMWTTMLITGSREAWENFFNLRNPVYEIGRNTFKSKKEVLNYYSDDPNFPELRKYSNLDWLQINKGQAEIHMMTLAEEIYDAMNESTPIQLQAGEWHVPFRDKIDNDILLDTLEDNNFPNDKIQNYLIKISTAMAAHTSYTIVGNEKVKSLKKWIEIHDKLISYDPPHSSPLEHCARAMSEIEYTSCRTFKLAGKNGEYGWCGPYKGFMSYRYFIDNNLKV